MTNKPSTAEHITKADTIPPLEERISYVRELRESASQDVRIEVLEALRMEHVEGSRFKLANPEQGLPQELVHSIQKRGQEYMRFEVNNVGINVECRRTDDGIVMSQSNLEQEYHFDHAGRFKG
jgi:hypothetical protein